MTNILHYWKPITEILLLWYFIYIALLFVKGTRTEQLLKGLIIVVIVFILTKQLKLEAINWAMERLFPISIIALVIIFQPEMRRGLARLGQFGVYHEDIEAIEEISKAIVSLSASRIGALIAIEREGGLNTYIETGVNLDSKVTEEMVLSIFMPRSPLHDGGVIVRRDRIMAAGCLFPLSQEGKGLSKIMGTRHKAALGLSEETDAVCLVVSEETGSISMAAGGVLTSNLSGDNLAIDLKNMFYSKGKKRIHANFLSRISPKISDRSVK